MNTCGQLAISMGQWQAKGGASSEQSLRLLSVHGLYLPGVGDQYMVNGVFIVILLLELDMESFVRRSETHRLFYAYRFYSAAMAVGPGQRLYVDSPLLACI